MRRQIRTVPDQLPYARLFVDDLEALEQILSPAAAKAENERAVESEKFLRSLKIPTIKSENESLALSAAAEEPERAIRNAAIAVTYIVEDTEMDSTDELLKQGGSVTDFEMRVSGSSVSLSVKFRGRYTPPRISLHALNETEQWAVYARVLDVFRERRIFMKNLVADLPNSVTSGVWLFMSLAPLVLVGLPLLSLLLHKANLSGAWNAVLYVYLSLASLCLVVSLFSFRSSKVVLSRSRERSKTSSETARKYAIGAITFVLGVLVSKLIDHLFR